MMNIQDGKKEKVTQMLSCCLIKNNEVMMELLIVNNILKYYCSVMLSLLRLFVLCDSHQV